ncbi:MAG: hypothetical protein HQK52_04145 [Oligoflexia bacterium]|nr:hypothetical protein [Oligoflexia bacterium]
MNLPSASSHDNYAMFFQNLKSDLPTIREVIIKTFSLSSDDGQIRSIKDALAILDRLEIIHKDLHECFDKAPSLTSVFDSDFIPFREFCDREVVIDTCFIEDYLFPSKEKLSFVKEDGEVDFTVLDAYVQTIRDWVEASKSNHEVCQKYIREKSDENFYLSQLACSCGQCASDFKNKLREMVLDFCQRRIDETIVKIQEDLSGANEDGEAIIEKISERIFLLQKEVDKKIHTVRSRLKKASISKIDNQLKSILKNRFAPQTEIGKRYSNFLRPLFEKHLSEKLISPGLVEEAEYERFYRQQGVALWKDKKSVLREFDKLVNSVLMLKRKDISSSILQEYLGQFWLHSDARKIKRKIIYHHGPTNSGKTYHAIMALCKASSGCYLAPLRLLAAELFDTMNENGVKTSLLTGEEVIPVEQATHYSSTVEMVKLHEEFDCAVIDEIQMLADSQRGWAWTRALVGVHAKEVHICGDDTAIDLVKKIVELTGDELEMRDYERMTKLEVMDHSINLGELNKGDALIVFSRKNALKYKSDLEKLGFKVSIIYGMLGPEVRREQARKFDQGETDIMVSTDAIAMGMNLPIKRIVFSTLSKFIDDKEYRLSHSEVKQIAGRAGRFKRFPIGHVTCLTRVDQGIFEIKEAMAADLEQKSNAMVGPDLDIYNQVNQALTAHSLAVLSLTEFLHLFNTMIFAYPFYCVDLKEMIEVTEIVEVANEKYKSLSASEMFGFACAPVNLGLVEHVQYFVFILNNYIRAADIKFEEINYSSDNIDYLETSIKCIELYQWLARHFSNKHFAFKEQELLYNKSLAIEKLNKLLSAHIVQSCSSCGKPLPKDFNFGICEDCFKNKSFHTRRRGQKLSFRKGGRSSHGGGGSGAAGAGAGAASERSAGGRGRGRGRGSNHRQSHSGDKRKGRP